LSDTSKKIGDQFLEKLYERTIKQGVETIDKYEIGKEIGFLDRTQTDNLVDELTDYGYIRKLLDTKIMISDDGRKRVEV
jgi:hypothetical protein